MVDIPIPEACRCSDLAEKIGLLASSYSRLLGRSLAGLSDPSLEAIWSADEAILAHGTEPDPMFFFGNATALKLFECDWNAFTRMPSRLSAEAPDRAERQRLLDRVSLNGYVDDYSGVRISALGRRFLIPRATVWNIIDPQGMQRGQAAIFPGDVEPVPHD